MTVKSHKITCSHLMKYFRVYNSSTLALWSKVTRLTHNVNIYMRLAIKVYS